MIPALRLQGIYDLIVQLRDDQHPRPVVTVLGQMGSHLSMPYLAAIGVLVVLEYGTKAARQLLPSNLVALWDHPKPTEA